MSDAMQRSGILEECGGRDWSDSEVGDIATGPIVPKSAINGHGYGSCHTWTHTHTAHVAKCSHYVCSVCGTDFAHYYNQVPDIFAAMLREAVPETCVVSAKKE
jgi:hypothetical protein